MKKYEVIRKLFDHVMENGKEYTKADAISAHCTRDTLKNRVHIKKVTLGIESSDGLKIDSMAVTCVKDDFSDATDSDLRIEFTSENPYRTILYANEVTEDILDTILKSIS